MNDTHPPAYAAEEALACLKEGNARFVSGHTRFLEPERREPPFANGATS
jgi:hypothetical protein